MSYYFHGMPSAPVSLFEAHVERAQRPNAKWMFELFLDVHPLFITTQDVQVLVMNLKDELRQLLTLLEPPYIEAYS